VTRKHPANSDTASDPVDDRIATWNPTPDQPTTAPWVQFVRDVVTAAGPRTPRDAATVLRYCATYIQHTQTTGEPLDAHTLFDADHIAAYRQTLTGPAGTQAAITSTLRRLHPTIGLAGTTRQPRPDTPTHHHTTTTAAGDGGVSAADAVPVTPDDVTAAIATFAPQLIPTERWNQTADLVRTIVRRTHPTTTRRATHLCRDVSYLASWAVATHREPAIDVILDPVTIEQFLTTLLEQGRHNRSVATFASTLHTVREANGIPLGDTTRRSFPAPTPQTPYDDDTIDLIYTQANRVPSHARRTRILTALGLMFGAGARPGEVGSVTPDDVTCVDGRWFVHFTGSGRTVPVLDTYAEAIAEGANHARTTGDTYLIGGPSAQRTKRLSGLLNSKDRWSVTVSPTRAWATWFTVAASTPGLFAAPIDLYAATGLRTLTSSWDLLTLSADRRLTPTNTNTNNHTDTDIDQGA
jgi:integrase